ncbi:MAG: glycosyltransferase family 47 protein, partial [Bacteroidia bacterium]|nr:glycosyltransferase family 47 protein [Bacteroidia bacterium]
YADYQPFFPSSIIRYKYLSKFIKSNVIHTDFILRESYRAGANTEEYKRKSTKEFYTNIEQNSYTLCIRGAGNFSVRFYETLAVGRIPVLIDTDCPLPLNDSIDWNVHCLILKDSDIQSIEQKLLYFHNSFNHEEFDGLQKSNRLLWENKLTRHGYFKIVHDLFLNNILKQYV